MFKKRNQRSLIPVLSSRLPRADAILPFLQEIDQLQYYTNFGELQNRLGQKLANMVGAEYSLCVSSATLGLELAIAASQLPESSFVCMPALNFPSAGHAVLNNKLTPLFCDVDEATGLMQIEHVIAATENFNVGAIMPSSLNGCGYPIGYWDNLAKELNIPVIIDAAGCIANQKASNGVSIVYSLHATKPLSSGEGGVVVSNDLDFLSRVQTMSNFGFENFQSISRGTNAKMSEYNAAIDWLLSMNGSRKAEHCNSCLRIIRKLLRAWGPLYP